MNEIETTATDIVDAAIKVHRTLGPGLLESAYQNSLAFELHKRNRDVLTEVTLPITHEGQQIDAGYRIDMHVDKIVIIENKVIEALLPLHEAQLLTYLKLKDCHLGFLYELECKINAIWDTAYRL